MIQVSLVVPTIGRPSLGALLQSLAGQLPSDGAEVVIVDDRPDPAPPLPIPSTPLVRLVLGAARGPAAARNTGWRRAQGAWVVFVDDDVVPTGTWWEDLQSDLRQPPEVAGVQGRIVVPPADGAALTDWAANTARLPGASWITADMAYRRDALAQVGGFDERFPRAFREDADLAFRVGRAAGRLVLGRRRTIHPVRREDRWISLRSQRGNSDDALLRRRYGPGWHRRLKVPHGRRPLHAFGTASALLAAAFGASALLARHRGHGRAAMLSAAAWALTTGEFVAARRTNAPGEPLSTLIATSVLIPPLAVGHWLRGWWRHRHVPRWR